MYSTDIGELAYQEQLKEGYRRSNKNNAAPQILSDYGRRHALGMKLQTTEELLKDGNALRTGDITTDIPVSSDYSVHRWVLRGRVNTSNIIDLCRILDIDYSDLLPEMLCYIRKTPVDERRLPADSTELELLPVEDFNQLEIPV